MQAQTPPRDSPPHSPKTKNVTHITPSLVQVDGDVFMDLQPTDFEQNALDFPNARDYHWCLGLGLGLALSDCVQLPVM